MNTHPENHFPSRCPRKQPRPAILASSIAAMLALGLTPSSLQADSIVVGSGSGASAVVEVFDATTGALDASFSPFGAGFTGGVSVAVGDNEIIVSSGKGGGTVNVYNDSLQLEDSFDPFGKGWTNGVSVAVADGKLVVGAGAGGTPLVNVYDDSTLLSGGAPKEDDSFLAFASTFKGGVKVAIADGDLFTGAGAGGAPQVNVYSDTTFAEEGNFLAFASTFKGGVNLAAGDGQLVVGAGTSSSRTTPQVNIYSDTTQASQGAFIPFTQSLTGGVNVAVGDGEIVAGAGASGTPQVSVFDATTLSTENSFLAFASTFKGGVSVAILPTTYTWTGSTSADWNTAANWASNSVPNGTLAQVNFGSGPSDTTPNITSAHITVGSLVFAANAPAYTLSVINSGSTGQSLDIYGAGITNNSSNQQTIVLENTAGYGSYLAFHNTSTITGDVQIENQASTTNGYGATYFEDSSSAGSATIVNTGQSGITATGLDANLNEINLATSTAAHGGFLEFENHSSAASATITNSTGGFTFFTNAATAGNAQITNSTGGLTYFLSASSTGAATITNNSGGELFFGGYAIAANAATVTNNAGGFIDIAALANGGINIGQVSGAGNIYLGHNNLTVGGQNANAAISGVISDGAAPGNNYDLPAVLTGGSLTKIGSGTLTLTGTNTYTGGTTIEGGTVAINGDTALGGAAGGVTLNGGTLEATANTDTGRTFVLGASGGSLSTSGMGTQLELDGLITGSGPLNLSTPIAGGGDVTLSGTASNTYTGLTTVQIGTVILYDVGQVAISGNVQVNALGVLSINTDAQIASTATVTNNGAFDFGAIANAQQTIGALYGSGTIANLQNTTGTLVVGAGNFGGDIFDGNGQIALTKQGHGTLILSGTNTSYSGATTITGGTLEVDGSTGSSNVTVYSGGALAGSGTVGGTVTVNSGGYLNPGSSATPGTLTVANLVLNAGATSTFRLGGAASDEVSVNGALTLGGNISLIGNAGFGPGTYNLFLLGSAFTNNGVGTITGAAGFSATLLPDLASDGLVQVSIGYLGTPQYWDGSHTMANGTVDGGSGTWNATAKNWTDISGSTNGAWQSGTAIFSGTGGTVTLGGPISAEALFFNSSGYTLTGSTLKLVGPNQAIDVVNAGVSTTIASIIAGTSGLAATGKGTLILTNDANTYTGGTSVTNGTLQLGAAGKPTKINATGAISIGNGGTLSLVDVTGNTLANAVSNGVIGSGTLEIDSTAANTLSGALTDGAVGQLALFQTGSSTTILTNSGNIYSGATEVSKGVLQIGTSALAGSIGAGSLVNVGTGGTLTLIKVSGGVLDNNIANGLGGTGLVKADSTTALTLSGILSDGAGPLALTQSGAGTTTLTGIDTYSGATTITVGTLQVGNGTVGALTGNTAVTVSGSGTLALDMPTLSTLSQAVTLSGTSASLKAIQSGTLTVSGTITGAGAFDLTGAGTTIVTGSDSYTGPTNVNAGILEIDGALTAASGVVNVGTDGTLTGSGSMAGDVTLTGNGVIALNHGTIGGDLNATGGTWNGLGYISGAVTSSSNTLTIAPGAGLHTVVGLKVTGGMLAGTGTLDGSLNYSSSASSIFGGAIVDNDDSTPLPSTVTMNHAGATLTLIGGNSYTGATTVSAGTLQIGNGAQGYIGSTAITVSGTGALVTDLPGDPDFSNTVALTGTGTSFKAIQAGNMFVDGVISDSGTFDQNGSGATVFEGAQSYTGPTNVNAGILQVNESLASSVVHVGTNGQLNLVGSVAGNATLTGSGAINAFSGQIDGTLAVTGGTWAGAGTVSKTVTSSANTFQIASGANLTATAGVNVTGGSITAADDTATLTGSLNDTSSVSSTFAGVIADGAKPSTVTLNHAGATLTLNGANTYTGATTVSAGLLQIGDGTNGSIGTTTFTASSTGDFALDLPTPLSGFATFANTVNLNGMSTQLQAIESGSTFVTGLIRGAGTFDQNGPGHTVFEVAEAYTGPTNVNAGILEVDGSLASSVVHVGTNGSLEIIGTVSGDATLTGSGIINSQGGQIGGTLAVTGGTWSGTGTVVKAVTSSADTFNIDGAATLTATGGVNVTGGTFTGTDGTATLEGSLNDTSSSSFTFAGAIADGAKPSSVTMNKAGATLTLSGTNTYTGATTITAGALDLVENSAISSSSPVTIGTAGTLTVGIGGEAVFGNTVTDNGHLIATADTFDAIGISGDISGTGNFTKNGSGFVSLSGKNGYKGGTIINDGILSVQNTTGSGTGSGAVTVNGGGTLAGDGTITGATKLNFEGEIAPSALPEGLPSSLQTLHLGALTWNGGGNISLQLGADGASDALALSGALTEGSAGSFDIILLDDGVTDTSSDYTLLTFASTNFTLSDFNLVLPADVTGTLVETSTSLMLDNASDPAPTPGEDANVADALVNADSTESAVGTPDIVVAAPAPEPGSAVLLSLGGMTLLGWRRRRRR